MLRIQLISSTFRCIALALATVSAACDAGVDLQLPPRPEATLAVDGIEPPSGFAGDVVRVRGKAFPRDPAAIQVLFNGYGARPEEVGEDGRELVVRVPAGIQNGPVTVTAGTRTGVSKVTFRYLGPGRLQRAAIVRERVLESGLGGLVRHGDDVFVLAQRSHHVVRVTGELARHRIDLLERPIDLADTPALGGKLVYATPRAVVAVPIGRDGLPRNEDATRFELGTERLFRVVVHPAGVAAVAASAHAVHVVPFEPDTRSPKTFDTGAAEVTGVTMDAAGIVYFAGRIGDGGVAVVVDPVTEQQRKATYPRALRGALLPFVAQGKPYLAVGVDGGLALLDVLAGAFLPEELDLLGSGAPGGLVRLGEEIVATLPESGRVVAVNVATRLVTWAVEVGGSPRQLVVGPAGTLYVTNPARNAVQIVDPVTHTLLGERHVGLGAGSDLSGPNGILHHERAATAERAADELLLVLARDANALLGLSPTTLDLQTVVLLQPHAVAFAATAERRVIVAHAGGRVGIVDLRGNREVHVEEPICSGAADACPKLSGELLALEPFDDASTTPPTPRCLVATTEAIEVRSLPDLALVSSKSAPAPLAFADVTSTGTGIAALLAATTPVVRELSFAWWRDATLSGDGAPIIEKIEETASMKALGVAALRRAERPAEASPAYFFLRQRGLGARPWLFAPERPSQALIPSPSLGRAPIFSPDGRQAIATDGESLAVAQGDLLGRDAMANVGVIDLGAPPTGYAYAPSGGRAFVVTGDSDTVLVLE